jgi:hypothetical protein
MKLGNKKSYLLGVNYFCACASTKKTKLKEFHSYEPW